MKKIFSAALAVSMMATMAATSFAATYTPDLVNGTFGTGAGYVNGSFNKANPTFKVDGGKVYGPVVGVYGPLTYDNEAKMINLNGYEGDVVEYGDVAYYALLNFQVDAADKSLVTNGMNIDAEVKNNNTDAVDGAVKLFSDADVVSSLKIKTKWEQGSDLVNSVSIVKKKVSNKEGTGADAVTTYDNQDYAGMETIFGVTATNLGYTAGGYYYFLAIDVKSSTSTSDSDIIGNITLTKSANPKVTEYVFDVNLTINWANSYLNTGSNLEIDSASVPTIKAEETYSIKFNYDDEIDMEFEDGSTFTVDVSGQGKLLVYYDNKFNSKVASKYPLADLNFWNGNGARFNRTGEMFIEANNEYEKFIYMLNADGSLSEVPGATYDSADEGFYFYTRTLGSYVLSDMELDLSASVVTPAPEVTTPEVTTPTVTNPSTGAAV